MKFADPKILTYLIWLVPFVFFFYAWSIFRRRVLIGRFMEKKLAEKIIPFYSEGRMFFLAGLRTLAIAFIILALAGPQWGFSWKENRFRGFDILIALDTSKSMLARDLYPDRLGFSKEKIKDFIKGIRTDRVGIIAFAGQAFLQCPLTVDNSGSLLVLNSLNVDSIPRGGTNIAEAVETAIRSYKDSPEAGRNLIVITDGENTTGDIEGAIKKAKENGLVISCIGVGSVEGDRIFLTEEDEGEKALKDREGNYVRSALDEMTLKKVAGETGGVYVRSSPEQFGLSKIYENISLQQGQKSVSDDLTKVYKERFQLFAVMALLLLILEFLMGRGRTKRMF